MGSVVLFIFYQQFECGTIKWKSAHSLSLTKMQMGTVCTCAFDANFHGFWHGFRAVNTTSTLCLYSRVYDWFWLHFTWALKGAHLNNQKLRPKNRLPHILNTSKELRLHIIFWMNNIYRLSFRCNHHLSAKSFQYFSWDLIYLFSTQHSSNLCLNCTRRILSQHLFNCLV